MNMRDLLDIERIVPRLKAHDKRDALRKLAAHAALGATASEHAITTAVLEHADLPVIAPGTGVSLSHALVPELSHPILTFARLDPTLDFGTADSVKTDLVALLLSPAESAGDHLRGLACVARTLRNPNVRELLRAAESRDVLYAILSGSDEEDVSTAAIGAAFPSPERKKRR